MNTAKNYRIAVVGNGRLSADYSGQVEGSDLIIRFNRCDNLNRNSGRRTDVLALSNSGTTGRHFHRPGVLTTLLANSGAADVWLARAPRMYCAFHRQQSVFDRKKRRMFRDHSGRILQALREEKAGARVFREEIEATLRTRLREYGASEIQMPSTGMLVVEYLVRNSEYHGASIETYGFLHTGFWVHPWEAEKRLLGDYLTEGKVAAAWL